MLTLRRVIATGKGNLLSVVSTFRKLLLSNIFLRSTSRAFRYLVDQIRQDSSFLEQTQTVSANIASTKFVGRECTANLRRAISR